MSKQELEKQNELNELDYAIRTGNFKMSMLVYAPVNPTIFYTDNPKRSLDLSLNKKKRPLIVQKFLGGLDPCAFCSVYDLAYPYVHGIQTIPNRETRKIVRTLEFDAVALQLSRLLPIDAETVKQMVLKKYTQGHNNILFIKESNSKGIGSLSIDTWKIVTKRPSTDQSHILYNKEAEKLGLKWRIRTSQTYVTKVYNG